MSALIIAQIICDKCDAKIIGTRQTKTASYPESYSNALLVARYLKWTRNLRYGPAKDFCAACSDGGNGDGATTLAKAVLDELKKNPTEYKKLLSRWFSS